MNDVGIQQNAENTSLQWRNPDAPDDVPFEDFTHKNNEPLSHTFTTPRSAPTVTDRTFGTEKDQIHCAFFLKTGACRYGSKCSKTHLIPSQSTTLLIRNFYEPLGFGTSKYADEDEDEELMVRFSNFEKVLLTTIQYITFPINDIIFLFCF
jgi:hypothetical protein